MDIRDTRLRSQTSWKENPSGFAPSTNRRFAESERLDGQRSQAVSPTEAAKEAFRTAYKAYQDASQNLTTAQRDLLAATQANAEVFRSAPIGDRERTVGEWNAEKARRAADAVSNLARHYEIVAQALRRQSSALHNVTDLAGTILDAINEVPYTAPGEP